MLTTVESNSTPAGLAAPAALAAATRFADLLLVPQRGGQDHRLGHHQRGLGFDVHRLDVILGQDVEPAVQFLLGVDLVLGEQLDGVLAGDDREDIDGVLEVGQAALFGFGVPFLGVIVAVEEDLLALLDDGGEQFLDGLVQVLAGLDSASSLVAMKSRVSATMVLRTVLAPAMLALEPTARNSNLLPVKANGLVRLRSPASLGSLGRIETPVSKMPPCLLLLAPPFSICSKMSLS